MVLNFIVTFRYVHIGMIITRTSTTLLIRTRERRTTRTHTGMQCEHSIQTSRGSMIMIRGRSFRRDYLLILVELSFRKACILQWERSTVLNSFISKVTPNSLIHYRCLTQMRSKNCPKTLWLGEGQEMLCTQLKLLEMLSRASGIKSSFRMLLKITILRLTTWAPLS